VAWLFLSMVFGDFKDYPSRMDFLGYLVISGILAGALTFLLYLPVFLHHQSFKVVFGNQFIESMSWEDFQVTAPIRLRETWQAWIGGFDPLVLDALIAGFFLSILLHWNISNSRIPLQLAAAAWLIPLVFIQRVQLWTKTWFFLLPLILLWCAAGLVGLAQLIFRRIPYGRWIHAALIAAEVGVVLYGGWQVRQTEYDHARSPGMEEQFVMYLQEHLREGDIIISNWISEPAISYYLLQYQIPVNKMFVKALPFKQAYVIVNQEININIQDVLHDRGLDPRIFKIDQAIVVQQRGNSTMYLVPVN
jgi:hypothetical protein